MFLCCCLKLPAQQTAVGGASGVPLTFGGGTGVSLPAASAAQSPFFGGTPAGTAASGVLDLSLADALDRGLKYNLGLLLTSQAGEQVRAARLRSLSDLLPNVNAHLAETVEQINLAALGVPPSFLRGASPIVGPFSIFDARATFRERLSPHLVQSLRAATENLRASQFSVRDARELVVLVVGGGYIQALAAQSRIAAIQAQLATAQTLYHQAVDMKAAGTVAGIEVLRAQVELQLQQQRLVAVQNDFEKAKLQLARAIGLPQGQQFRLVTAAPYQPLPPVTLEEALARAFRGRPDYQSAAASVRAAEASRRAAVAERLPSLEFNSDYGVLGNQPGRSHGTFTASGAVMIPVFQGGKIRSDIQAAEAVLKQRQAQLDDTRARIELDVRSAFLDLASAAQQVEVALSSVRLATEQLRQAQDRFAAGVANNIEVVQAQESLALSNENYISSLLSHNLAKLSLARALGAAETSVREFLGGR
jgi:outer membrane protein TolC